jgi:hypothetical protein
LAFSVAVLLVVAVVKASLAIDADEPFRDSIDERGTCRANHLLQKWI